MHKPYMSGPYVIIAENCGNCGHIDTEAECPVHCIHKKGELTPEDHARIAGWLDWNDEMWNKRINDIHDPGCTGNPKRCDCF